MGTWRAANVKVREAAESLMAAIERPAPAPEYSVLEGRRPSMDAGAQSVLQNLRKEVNDAQVEMMKWKTLYKQERSTPANSIPSTPIPTTPEEPAVSVEDPPD